MAGLLFENNSGPRIIFMSLFGWSLLLIPACGVTPSETEQEQIFEEPEPGQAQSDPVTEQPDPCETLDCTDNNPCTQDDCAQGACRHVPETDGTPCDDALFCTAQGACLAGVCTTDLLTCDDQDDCTADSCDEAADRCVHARQARPGKEGLLLVDSCSNGLDDDCDGATDGQDADCHQCNQDSDCDDADPCTLDQCRPDDHACVHELQPLPEPEGVPGSPECQNGLDDDCDALADIQDPDCQECTTDQDCQDADPCTTNRCLANLCHGSPAPDGTSCKFGTCSSSDSCQSGICRAGPSDRDADQDGYVDFLCPEGTDCDDTHADVHPNGVEQPGSCADGMDNDCDGLTDADEPACAPDESSQLCDASGWCWQHPFPQGNDLSAAWFEREDRIWAAGASGTVIRGNPKTGIWRLVETGIREKITGLAIQPNSRLLAIGDKGSLLEYDPAVDRFDVIRETPRISLSAIWSVDSSAIWAIASYGDVVQTSGEAWDGMYSMEDGSLFAIGGLTDEDIWAAGGQLGDGLVVHFDGQSWTRMDLPSDTPTLLAVWAAGKEDVWAGGLSGALLHYDGQAWSRIDIQTKLSVGVIRGAAPNDIWLSGGQGMVRHFNGYEWENRDMEDNVSVKALSISPSGQVISVGGGGDLRLFEEQSWRLLSARLFDNAIHSAWGTADEDLWAISDQDFVHFDGSHWTVTAHGEQLQGIHGTSANDIWAAGMKGVDGSNGVSRVYHFDGNEWSASDLKSDLALHTVWANAIDDVWIAAENSVLHYDGAKWTIQDVKFPEYAETIFSTGPEDVWVGGGSQGFIAHKDNVDWTVTIEDLSTLDFEKPDDLDGRDPCR